MWTGCWGKSSCNPTRDGDVPVAPTAGPGWPALTAPSQERDFGLKSAPLASLQGQVQHQYLQVQVVAARVYRHLLDRNILGIPTEPLRNLIQTPKKYQANTREILKPTLSQTDDALIGFTL